MINRYIYSNLPILIHVKAVLINIFGGIVRCDLIAGGIIAAVREVGIEVPVVIRLEGTNAEQGLRLLDESGLALETASDLTEAAEKVVAAARKRKRAKREQEKRGNL